MHIGFREIAAIGYCITAIAAATGQSLAQEGNTSTLASEFTQSVEPRLASLLRQVEAGDTNASDRFWQEVKDNCPIVRCVASDNRRSHVTFVWRVDAQTKPIFLLVG